MSHKMQLRLMIISALCVLMLAGCAPGIMAVAPTQCGGDLEATVYHGPSAGTKLKGKLDFQIDAAGSLEGSLVTEDGGAIPVVGQVNGRAVNLVFEVSEEHYIFGVGAGEAPIYQCTGYMGGGFTGPQPGDSGDWGMVEVGGKR
jgi:hypothetical protein